MTPDTYKSTSAVETMKSFKPAWDEVPADAKMDTSRKHYQAAEISYRVLQDWETNRQLDAASVTRPPFAQ